MLLLAVFIGCFLQCHSLYSSSDDVIELTSSTFSQLLSSSDLWLVEFYAPWCGHCQSLAPEWKKAATALKGVVKVGAVDMDKHPELGQPYNVQGFPTIKIFAQNKRSPLDYNGGRSASGIVDAALRHLDSLVRARLSGGGGGSYSGGGSSSDHGSRGESGGSDVIELTDSNFESTVLQSDDLWIVEFFAPWCGHCKSLKPHWERAATELKGKVKVGAVDATVHSSIAGRYGVRGYPTIKMFPAGKKSGDAEDYDGGRTSDDIVRWALDKAVESIAPPEVHELIDDASLTKACEEHQLCMVSALPHILDCQSECRQKYIGILRELAAKYKKQQWGWLWAEAASQPKMEQAFEIGGFGYPAMVAVNSRKLKFAVLRGAFSEHGINEFLRELAVGRGSTAPVRGDKMPSIETRQPWDGKDAKPPAEEEIDLDELGIGKKTEL